MTVKVIGNTLLLKTEPGKGESCGTGYRHGGDDARQVWISLPSDPELRDRIVEAVEMISATPDEVVFAPGIWHGAAEASDEVAYA